VLAYGHNFRGAESLKDLLHMLQTVAFLSLKCQNFFNLCVCFVETCSVVMRLWWHMNSCTNDIPSCWRSGGTMVSQKSFSKQKMKNHC